MRTLADELALNGTGLQQMLAIASSDRKIGIFESLRLSFGTVDRGRVSIVGDPGDHAYNPIGTVHGGYTSTILDSACGCAVHTMLDAEQAYTTLELKVAFHSAITRETGTIEAVGTVVRLGKRVAYAEAKLLDKAQRLLASATSTLLIMPRDPQKLE